MQSTLEIMCDVRLRSSFVFFFIDATADWWWSVIGECHWTVCMCVYCPLSVLGESDVTINEFIFYRKTVSAHHYEWDFRSWKWIPVVTRAQQHNLSLIEFIDYLNASRVGLEWLTGARKWVFQYWQLSSWFRAFPRFVDHHVCAKHRRLEWIFINFARSIWSRDFNSELKRIVPQTINVQTEGASTAILV